MAQVMPLDVKPDPVIVHQNSENIHVRYHANISSKYKRYLCLCGCACLGCCRAEEALRRTYFEVHENRVEVNYPIPTMCCVIDAIDVLYFDRDRTKNVGKADCCTPAWTHMSFFPTCCNLCGEGIVMYSDCCGCWKPSVLTNLGGCFCLRQFNLFGGMVTAATTVAEVIRARNDWVARVGPDAGIMK
jgi:hypothetical protein